MSALNELDVLITPNIRRWYENWKKERADNTT